jgi:hypothetical protein
MSSKHKITILFSCIGVLLLFFIIDIYLKPILITRGNNVFNDNYNSNLVASVRLSKKQRTNQSLISSSSNQLPSNFSFFEDFITNYIVKESGNLNESESPGWWLSSGAYFNSKNGIGSSIIGPLSALDPWRIAFSLSNPLDTDNGYYPQNIFRLILTKNRWKNFEQEIYFNIVKNNLSISTNRNSSNGILFFNRYQDAFNLYYTGIRVDGAAVIKKKINGIYYTLAYKPIYGDPILYNRETSPNLIPIQKWIGIKSETITNLDNTVTIKLSIDKDGNKNWILALEVKDDNKSYGDQAFLNDGYVGVRTDFMDVEFDNYRIISK